MFFFTPKRSEGTLPPRCSFDAVTRVGTPLPNGSRGFRSWRIMPQLKAAGAEGIVEYPLNKVVL